MDSNDGDRTLTLKNTQIYNSANIGLLARTADIYGENLVINNSGQSSLALSLGGTYTFNHCTFVNYWANGFRSFPALQIDNGLETENGVIAFDLTQANFNNCIIYGSENIELGLFPINESTAFNFSLNSTLLRFNDINNNFEGNPIYEFDSTVVVNIDPAFKNTRENNFNIEKNVSGAEGIADPSISNLVPLDLNGTTRNEPADAGAYQSTEFPPEG
jgi:hypothetical protein